MATLGVSSLTGCDSIPGFIASGTKTVFEMATTPVSWTKDTGKNQSMLRVVSGSLSPGGSQPFPTIFTPAFPVSTSSSAVYSPSSTPSATSTMSYNPSSAGPLTVSPTTISNAQMSSHGHPYASYSGSAHFLASGGQNQASSVVSGGTGSTGSGGSHTHPGSTNHYHFPVSGPHSHPFTQGLHSHSFSSSLDFGIQYIDIIVATKD
jgi:hypothetical protein